MKVVEDKVLYASIVTEKRKLLEEKLQFLRQELGSIWSSTDHLQQHIVGLQQQIVCLQEQIYLQQQIASRKQKACSVQPMRMQEVGGLSPDDVKDLCKAVEAIPRCVAELRALTGCGQRERDGEQVTGPCTERLVTATSDGRYRVDTCCSLFL